MANNNTNKKGKPSLIIVIVALVIFVASGGSIALKPLVDYLGEGSEQYASTVVIRDTSNDALQETQLKPAVLGESEEQSQENETEEVYIRYEFRKQSYLDEHYEKHGIEMGFASAQEYLAAANAMITNKDVLTKKEAEDNDDVYFLEATGEFAVVSTDGYLRTYYLADKDYFLRQ